MKWLWEFRYPIIYIVWLVISCVVMGKQWVRSKAKGLMLAAKQMSKDGLLSSGEAQKEWVVTALYILLVRLKIPFVTKEMLYPLVSKLYNSAMDLMDDGELNGSYQ